MLGLQNAIDYDGVSVQDLRRQSAMDARMSVLTTFHDC
jgi:hypothetical protein